jgi:nucleoside phosphorylase
MHERTVALLAPMQHELAPIVRRLSLTERDGVWRGSAGEVEVLALLTTMGMAAGAAAAERAIGLGADHVMVVGIAGGVDTTVSIGDLVEPEVVVDRAGGGEYRPARLRDVEPRGVLSCGDDLIVDPEALAAMAGRGVVAVDMETAAVARVCEAAGRPWSVFRSISDYAGEGLVDDELWAMTRPDGSADPEGMARYLEARPERMQVLARLGHDMERATEAAAAAAVAACERL